jgi:hypothetical protein
MIVVGSTKSDKVSDKSADKTLRAWRMVEFGPSVRTRKKRKVWFFLQNISHEQG